MSTQGPIKVSTIMTKKLETIGSTSTAQDVAIKMSKKQVSSILVIDDKDESSGNRNRARSSKKSMC
jgi:CBS domain-containing protein